MLPALPIHLSESSAVRAHTRPRSRSAAAALGDHSVAMSVPSPSPSAPAPAFAAAAPAAAPDATTRAPAVRAASPRSGTPPPGPSPAASPGPELDLDPSSSTALEASLDAMRTSVDQRAIADIGSSLDRLEAIPTLSLDDFLTFRGGARAGSSDAGTESHHGGGASEPDDARTPATHYDADTDLEVPEEVDPRVQDALEELNLSMTSVNALEGRLSAARKARKQTRLEQEKRLASVERALSSSVRATVPYFHRVALANLYQTRSIEALRTYERAHDMHAAAKKAFAALESRLDAHRAASPASPSGGTFDARLMVASSDAITKVTEMETMKKRAELAHAKNTRLATSAVNESSAFLGRLGKRAVERARPYFTAKAQAEAAVREAEEAVREAQERVKEGKTRYHAALDALASISEDVHARREAERAERERREREEEAGVVERRVEMEVAAAAARLGIGGGGRPTEVGAERGGRRPEDKEEGEDGEGGEEDGEDGEAGEEEDALEDGEEEEAPSSPSFPSPSSPSPDPPSAPSSPEPTRRDHLSPASLSPASPTRAVDEAWHRDEEDDEAWIRDT